ncbi:MAG: cytochrome c [Bryobacteraceae bacterium]|nr:cytochrome c [Bryobacteraceae bacterium]
MVRSVILLLAGAVLAPAHDLITTKLTWSVEISRIVYRRCASCHRDGGPSPMPLVTWEEARPWAKAIRDEVLARRMPPWGAVRGYSDLQHDPSLTQDEMTRIAEWVEGGAPEGDPKYLPPSIPDAPPAAKPMPGRTLRTVRLTAATVILGLTPLADVASAKIYAQRPDGTIEPLLRLRDYKQKWARTYLLAEPLKLPAGTRIVSEPPVSIQLLTR